MRRKVVKVGLMEEFGCTVYFNVTLECGHKTVAYGRAPKGQPFARKTIAPKTVTCVRCQKEKQS